ncbi:MAG TPA: hypothetical protein VG248_02305 [Caulobacteraceae bacterium]|jgi:hypothetical protein|nr:hypothetical protein [Caulobacteraceae bacterium]
MGHQIPHQAWDGFFTMLGGASGALVGLLFIVMSLHFDKLNERNDANARVTIEGGRNNTYHLLTVLVECGLTLIPQPMAWLGAELIVVELFGLRLPLTITTRYLKQHITISERGRFPTAVIVTVTLLYLAGAAGGALLAAGREAGLWIFAAATLGKVVRTVLTAWMLMFGAAHVRVEPQPKA